MNQRIWTPVDITRLLDYIKKKKSLEDISRKEKRSVLSIQSKLKEIAVNLYFNKNISYAKVEEITGIQKESLVVKRIKHVNIPERSGSPKEVEPIVKTSLLVETSLLVKTSLPVETIQSSSGYTLRISTDNPFSIESLSSLIHSTVGICLLPRS